jgi:F-box interacting protein
MNTEWPMLQCGRQSNPSASAIIPDDLVIEILSLLKVKPLMKMKCVSKSWNTLISDPKFVKMHRNRSSRNSQYFLVSKKDVITDYSFVPFSISHLMENDSIDLPNDPYYQLIDKDCRKVVGSCNGLVCLLGYSLYKDDVHNNEAWLRFWNPATRTISDKSGYFHYDMYKLKRWKFTFGYDNSTETYKVVALHSDYNLTTAVQVLSFGDNIWRNIQSFNARLLQFLFPNNGSYCDVHLNCTVNWLAYIKNDDFDYKFVIISLDLGTETHTQLLLPPDSRVDPVSGVCVLMGSLCFHHEFEGTNFVIWMMTKFGDEKSWTQFFKFSYQDLQINSKFDISCNNVFQYGDTLVFTHFLEDRAILYNWRKNKVVKTSVDKKIHWSSIYNYVESLVSTW